jgi:transposase
MGDLSDCERGQIIGVCLNGASVTKAATLLCVSRVTVSKNMSAYIESWEDNISEEEQWAKINIDIKRSSYIEEDCFEKSQNYCSTGDRTTELNIHLGDPISTKTVQCELHRSNNHSRVSVAKPLITKSSA